MNLGASPPVTVLLALGTRPEAIKLAPIYRQLQADSSRWSVKLCVTGQHRSLLDDILSPQRIVPDYDLNVMRPDQRTSDVAAAVLGQLGDVVGELKPHAILVQGDTTSAMAAGMLGYLNDIPVGHVEAGLRTGDLRRPFPEEFNRRVLSLAATWHFAPTSRARDHLLAEGIADSRIVITGNTGIDALLAALKMPFTWDRSPLAKVPADRPILAVTLHRRESFGAPLHNLADVLARYAAEHPELNIVFPVHPNPRVQEAMRPKLGHLRNVYLVQPLQYLPFVNLLARSFAILTDSGGVQEEAPTLGKPILVVRDVTERPEAVEAGLATLVGTDPQRVYAALTRIVAPTKPGGVARPRPSPYGDGLAAERIVRFLKYQLAEPLLSAHKIVA